MWNGATGDTADDEVSPNDAIDWFVWNGSDEEPGPWHLRRWAVWFVRSGNRADYASVFELERELRMLPAPRWANREVLAQDVVSAAPVAS
jgi:hypothetical protein